MILCYGGTALNSPSKIQYTVCISANLLNRDKLFSKLVLPIYNSLAQPHVLWSAFIFSAHLVCCKMYSATFFCICFITTNVAFPLYVCWVRMPTSKNSSLIHFTNFFFLLMVFFLSITLRISICIF